MKIKSLAPTIIALALAATSNACGVNPSIALSLPKKTQHQTAPNTVSNDNANSAPKTDPELNTPAVSPDSNPATENPVSNPVSVSPENNPVDSNSNTATAPATDGNTVSDTSVATDMTTTSGTASNTGTSVLPSSTLDIVYRTDVESKYTSQVSLDVHYSESNKTKPVFIFIHGGGWISGDKGEAVNAQVSQLGAFVQANGYLLVSANYRLVDIEAFKQNLASPTYREQASDVAHVVGWVVANISKYGGNPNKIVLVGHSAGAHLAPLVAMDSRYLAQVGLTASSISKVISLDVHAYNIPYAIQLMTNNTTFSGQIPSLKLMFGQTSTDQLKASPANYITSNKSLPEFLILSAGLMKGTVQDLTKKTSMAFVNSLKGANFIANHYDYPTETHSSMVTDINTTGDQPAIVIRQFLSSLVSP
ncbi:MAG: Carboxylesterase NlhH [Pseudomonadota bacterium]|jgi:acetyl esterase/lipase